MAEEIKYRNLGAFSSAGGFNVANADPIDSRQLVADISHIYMDGNWAEVKPYPGLIVSAPSGEARIYVGREWSTANQHTDWRLEASWKKIGSGSVAVDTYSEAIAMATADTIGQVIYVKTKSTYNDAEYEAAPYIVIAAGSLQKLAASTAGGNIANDLAALTTRVGTAEGEIDALQDAVGDSTKGLVKSVADLNTLTAGHATRITANENAVTELRSAVAGGVHFVGIFESLPTLFVDEDTNEIYSTDGEDSRTVWQKGDIIIISKDQDGVVEPTKEYILASDGDRLPMWIEIGDLNPATEKIAKVEKDFNDHVKAMDEQWDEHVEAYTKDKATFALKSELQSHINDTYTPAINTINQEIDARKVKNVDTTGNILSLDNNGNVKINLTGYVAKDGNKVLSTNDYTNDEKTKLGNIALYAQVNVIEEVKVDNKALTVTGKSVNIDLSSYAKDADKVDKTTTVNDQPLSGNVTIDAQDIKTLTTIGTDNAGATVETVLTTLNTKIGSVSTIASSALQEVSGSTTITVTNKNTVSVKVKANSAIKATADGLDLEWEMV